MAQQPVIEGGIGTGSWSTEEGANLTEQKEPHYKVRQLLFSEILKQTNNLEISDIESIDIDKNLIERIVKYASIKHILIKYLNDDEKILEIFSEIIRDLKNYELEVRIEELESRFSKDLSEVTFNELKELKKLQKIN